MDFNRPETTAEGLNNVDKLFLFTPTHPEIEFTSNLVEGLKRADGLGNEHIVKLSHIRADAQLEITITRYIEKQKKLLKSQESHIHFYAPTSLCKTLSTSMVK